MRNYSLLLIAAIAASLAACSKSDDSATPGSTIPADGWKLGATGYKQSLTVRQDNQGLVNALDGTAKPINTFGVCFKTYPTASGSYKIVGLVPDSVAWAPNSRLAAGEVVLIATTAQASGSNKTYYTTGVEGKSATVTVTGGKIKIEVPEIAVTSGASDTLKLTGTIAEK